MYRETLFIIGKIWNQLKLSPKDNWIKKLMQIKSMGYYLTIKMLKIVLGRENKAMLLNKISQRVKHNYNMFYFFV